MLSSPEIAGRVRFALKPHLPTLGLTTPCNWNTTSEVVFQEVFRLGENWLIEWDT